MIRTQSGHRESGNATWTAKSVVVVMLSAALLAGGCDASSGERPLASAQPGSAGPRIEFDTTAGRIVIELDPVRAPLTARHVLDLVERGYYDGSLFYQSLPKRFVAGGRRAADAPRLAAPTVRNEWSNGLRHKRGTIAMCRRIGDPRTMQRRALQACIDSASAEFFINTMDNAHLDLRQPDGAGYTVFGRVIAGMDVVDALARCATTRDAANGEPGMLIEPVVIRIARRAAD